MERITADISSFETLRKDGFVYVDKTDLLWRLASSREGRQFFISRPRRFGKSLMLSTLKSLFGLRTTLVILHLHLSPSPDSLNRSEFEDV